MLRCVVYIVTSAFCRFMMLLIILVRNTAYWMTLGFFTLWRVYRRCVVVDLMNEIWLKLADHSSREPYKIAKRFFFFVFTSVRKFYREKCVFVGRASWMRQPSWSVMYTLWRVLKLLHQIMSFFTRRLFFIIIIIGEVSWKSWHFLAWLEGGECKWYR